MIGSSFLGSSSFDSDPLIGDSFDIFDIDQLDNRLAALEREQTSCSASPVHSSSSDDCDLSVFGDVSSILPVVDAIASQLLEDEESIIDSLDLNDLDWVCLSDSFKGEISATESVNESYDTFETPRKKRKHTKSSKSSSNAKSWSRMTSEERLRTAHALSEVISQRMGLSHQIEVIKLIDPTAVLTPSTKEFTINLSYLNDTKLKRIQEYIKKHAMFTRNSDVNFCNNKKNSRKNNSGSTSSNSSSNCESSYPGKRKQKKYKSSHINELKVDEWKYIEQGKKEKRSGLFVKEKVIKKLNSNPSEEDEDVNILD